MCQQIRIGAPSRNGVTLLEVCVVIAIILALSALLMPALQRIRSEGNRIHSQNNIRQIILAVHNYAVEHGSRPPAFGDLNYSDDLLPFHYPLLPYLEAELRRAPKDWPVEASLWQPIPIFISPADPSLDFAGNNASLARKLALISYPMNYQAFQNGTSFKRTFKDGLANTIAVAERYSFNCEREIYITWNTSQPGFVAFHRPTFADGAPAKKRNDTHASQVTLSNDVYPVVTGSPPVAPAFRNHWKDAPFFNEVSDTFQVRPTQAKCRLDLPQTPHSAMLTAFADGSVRSLAPSIATAVFWGAVTPNGNESISFE